MIAIESESKWLDALKKTMTPYADQVTFYEKFLDNENDESRITLDEIYRSGIIKKTDSVLIKMDIEGAEEHAIIGGERLFNEVNRICLLACSYHHHNGVRDISNLMKKYGMSTSVSHGYMYFPPSYEESMVVFHKDEDIYPELRRGIVKGVR